MKLIIKKDLLNEKLNVVSKAISTKNIIPVLGCIKFELKKEGLFLTACNDDITIETFIDKKEIEKIDEVGSIVIPKKILDIIRKLEKDILVLETDNLKLIINNYEDGYLNCMDVTEYPNVQIEEQKDPIILDEKQLRNTINETCFAVSTQESRPILTGLNMVISDNKMECVATDSYRLAKKTLYLDKKQKEVVNIVVPGKNLIDLTKLLLDDDSKVELHVFNNNILFKTKEMLFQSRLLNNTYPDTSKLIPDSYEITVDVNLNEFFKAIDYVSLLTSDKEKNLIKMEINGKNMKINCVHESEGELNKSLIIKNTKPINIAYSSKYMLEALKAFDCEDITISMNGEIKPIIITNKNDDSLVQLILPIKTF